MIPLFPNSMQVVTADGAAHRFVLMGRTGWISELSAPTSDGAPK